MKPDRSRTRNFALKKNYWINGLYMASVVPAIILPSLIWPISGKQSPWFILVRVAPQLVVVICYAVWLTSHRRRVRAQLDAARGMLCPACGYDLSGQTVVGGAAGTCPECGENFTMDGVHRAWREWVPPKDDDS